MITFKNVCRALCAIGALVVTGCVDESYRVSDVSTEVTVCDGTTTLPIGYFETKTLGDLLEGQEIDGLIENEDGTLTFKYDGEGDTTTIDGISTEFEIPEIKSSFTVDYPAFDFDMAAMTIAETMYIEVAGLEGFSVGGQYELPDNITLPTIAGSYTKIFEGEDFHINFEVPEQVDNINKVMFRSTESGHKGTPMHVKVALNGLAGINGGGTLNFNFEVKGAELKIVDDKGRVVCDGNKYNGSYEITPGVEYIDFVLYVESLTNTQGLDSNHCLNIPLEFSYDMDFEINAKQGTFSPAKLPSIELNAEFEYEDAEVSLNSDISLIDCEISSSSVDIEGLPSELVAVKSVNLKQNDNAVLEFYARGLEWLGNVGENLVVEVELPEFLKLHAVGENYTYDAVSHTITAPISSLGEGLAIGIESLDFGAEGISPDENGNMKLNILPRVKVHAVEDSTINVSDLVHGDFKVDVGIAKSLLSVESISGWLNYAYEFDQEFALTGLDDLDIEVEGVGIKPVIAIDIAHPLTADIKLNGSVIPTVGGEQISANAVVFEDVTIPGAKYLNGSVEQSDVHIIIADESLRGKYSDSKYTFVACDVTKLICGAIPETVIVSLEVGIDDSEMVTVYVPEGDIAISYDYSIEVPIELDNSLKIRYHDEISGLGSTFEQIAGLDVKVGDVALIATVSNSTPLQLGANVVLKDKDGNKTTAQVRIAGDGMILGSEDGINVKESVLRLELDLGETGDIQLISEIDAVEFELEATSAAGESAVPLKLDQGVGVQLQVELSGGVTVDVESFL